MKNFSPVSGAAAPACRKRRLGLRPLFAVLWCSLLGGCAALTNPVADGIPVRRLPAELLDEVRNDEQSVPLNLLHRSPPAVYRLAPGDVLGIWFDGVPLLSQANQMPPINIAQRPTPAERAESPPSLGLPFIVREDGSLALPGAKPVLVRGMSLDEARAAIADAYVKAGIIQPGAERLVLNLMRQRQTHVLVFRQDIVANVLTGNLNNNFVVTNVGTINGETEAIGRSTTGAGYVVDLPGYDNDVVSALAHTGGLPASNSAESVVIYRGLLRGDPAMLLGQLRDLHPGCKTVLPNGPDSPIVHIPLRVHPGEDILLRPEDAILQNGDVVLVQARELSFFYTAGLLPPGQHVMPRDFDLNVVQAVMRVRGPLVNGAFSQSNLSGAIIPSGIGSPSPSLLTVVRQMPGGGQVAIRVDLNRALRDPRENILVQTGDVLVLQESPGEALVRYFTQNFHFDFVSRIISGNKTNGTVNAIVP